MGIWPSNCTKFCFSPSSRTHLTSSSQLRGLIDSATAQLDFEMGTNVPILGYQKLTALHGSVRDGIVGTYDCGAGNGMVTVFHKGRDVWLDVSFKSVYARVDRSSFIVSLPKVCNIATQARGKI